MLDNKNNATEAEDVEVPTQEPTSAPPLPDHLAETLHQDPVEATSEEDDPEVDKAVDDITTHEADEVLAAEDAELAKAFDPKPEPKGFRAKIAAFARAWWSNKKLRYGSLAGLTALLIIAASVPQSRYFVLNTTGVRASASVVVLDNSTQQPLKNVTVTAAGQTATTDSTGTVKLTNLKLGSTQLTVERRAFAPARKKIVIGWGSNPLGNLSLTATGSRYVFAVNDFLSNKPVAKAEANSSDADAVADEQGQLVLTVDPNESNDLSVTIKAEGYRDVTVPVSLDDKSTHKIAMVPSQKHVFVSKRSGKYDLYAIDVDGTNEKVLLAGTGNERDDISVAANPANNVVALVSSRANTRNKEGYLLSDLNIIDIKTGQQTPVTQSEKIQVIDWIGSRVIFVQETAAASASTPNRQRLISYDYSNNSQKELASSDYFYNIVSANGNIYYATSDASQNNPAAFYKINPDGTSRITLLNKESWNIFRTQYDRIALSVNQDWYEYKIGEATTSKSNGAPASQQNRAYQDDEEHKNSLWVDSRDGKGVLLKYDTTEKKDTVLQTQSGLTGPTYWLNGHYAVYRVRTEQETADYVVNLDGGQPRKITNATNTSGLGQGYSYR